MDVYRNEARVKQEDRLKGWVYLALFGLLFLLYGLFMYMTVGDKGPPDWDFGGVEDTPGKSIYSTYPEPDGSTGDPLGQHVNGESGEGTTLKKVEIR